METETRRASASTIIVVSGAAAVLMVVRIWLTVDPLRGLWAEDGAVFLQDAMRHPWQSLTPQYAGYGLLVPRLLGELGHVFPADQWPLLILVVSAIVTGAVSAVVFDAARSLDLTAVTATIAAVVPVLLPGFGFDILGAWTNLHWSLAYALAWVLIVPMARSRARVAFTVALFAVGGSIVAIFVCPLVLLQGRRWYRHPAIPGIVLGGIYQIVVQFAPSISLRFDRTAGLTPWVAKTIVLRTGRALFDSGGGVGSSVWGYAGAVCIIVIAVVVATSARRRTGIVLLGCAAVMVVALSVANGSSSTARYGSLSVALAVVALLLAVGVRGQPRGWQFWLAIVLCSTWALALPVSTSRGAIPDWDQALRAARSECERGARDVRLPVGPIINGRPWGFAHLSCESL